MTDSFDDLRKQFRNECVLHALDRARQQDREHPPDVLFLDEDAGRIHRVLDATRGSPDSGWFVLALAGPNTDDGFERQLRIHDSDTHLVLLESEIEQYAKGEPTPADDVVMTSDGPAIIRMGHSPIPVGDQDDKSDDE